MLDYAIMYCSNICCVMISRVMLVCSCTKVLPVLFIIQLLAHDASRALVTLQSKHAQPVEKASRRTCPPPTEADIAAFSFSTSHYKTHPTLI